MTTFNNAFIWSEPAIGSASASWGSNIFVVHNDASQDDTKWNEPHVLVAAYTDGQGAEHTNSQEIIVPDAGLHLELYATSDTAADYTLEIGVFGKVPVKSGLTGTDRRWPQDIDTTNYGSLTDFWIPLQNQEAVWVAKDGPTTGEQDSFTLLQIEGQAPAFEYDDGLGNADSFWIMGPRTAVYLAGCTSICVGVKATDSVSNGLILGRFVG